MPKRPRRVLVITRNFPPLVGGMERLVFNAYQELRKEFQCDVISPRSSPKDLEAGSRNLACPVSPIPLFLFCAALKGVYGHLRAGYSIFFAGSGITAPLAIIFAKSFSKRSVIYLHGLDIIADSWLYQRFFVSFFRYADRVIVNSRNTARLAQEKGVPRDNIEIVHPGVDLPRERSIDVDFARAHGLEGCKVLLSVGRIIPRKGLLEFVENSLGEIIRAEPSCKLLIVGAEARQALNRERGYRKELERLVDAKSLRAHVIFSGYLEDGDLASAYSAAHVFVFPLRPMPNDVEGFGMVAVEAAAHGLQTVAFDVGGVADAIEQGVSGELIESGNYGEFALKTIELLANSKNTNTQAKCRNHATKFSWAIFGGRLRQVFNNL